MSEHTDGPWFVDTTVALGPYNILTESEAVPDNDCIVCSFEFRRRIDPSKRPRLEADARLIAAAPDLLAACERSLAALAKYRDGLRAMDCESYIPDLEWLLAGLKAALARVQGKEVIDG